MRYLFAFAIIALLLSACAVAIAPTATTAPIDIPVEAAPLPESSCTAITSVEQENAAVNSQFEPVTEADWSRGAADAPVTIMEYSDFQCPFCAELAATLQELATKYPEELRIVYRHFPLLGTPEQPIHDKAAFAMQAAEAAGRQGKFWEMHDALFTGQVDWTGMSLGDFENWLMNAASDLELDTAQFAADINSEELAQMAETAWTHGQELEISYTPYLVINGLFYSGPIDIDSLEAIIQVKMLTERQFKECPPMILEEGADYTATLHTVKGDIVIELYPDVAPMAVNSFVFLAQNDWYDNVTFHRVLPGFVAQGGDPSGTGYGEPGYFFAIEVDPQFLFDRAGLLAMANSGPTSNGSQFFITLAPAEHLNGGYTIFGEVIQGMDVVENLTPRDPSQAAGLPPGDLILDVSIEAH